MNTRLSLLSLFLLFGFAQSQFRFVYKATFAPVKGKKNTQTEYMALDVIGNKSMWYSLNATKIDSLISKKNFGAINEVGDAFLNHLVVKDIKKQSLTYTEKFNNYPLTYVQSPKYKWKLSKETGKILEHSTQLATCDFGGRSWIAHFSTDFAMSDGPYKFSGLPGLILKLESVDKDYTFELESVQKISTFSKELPKNNQILKEKSIKEFKKKFMQNPSDYPINLVNKFQDRYEYNPAEAQPKEKASVKESIDFFISRYNNPIETDDILLLF